MFFFWTSFGDFLADLCCKQETHHQINDDHNNSAMSHLCHGGTWAAQWQTL
jgi:hypothetical protein